MKLLYLAVILLSPLLLFGQNISSTDTVNIMNNHSLQWQEYFQNDLVKIEYNFSNCDPELGYDNEAVILRFTNLSSAKITLSWNSINFYDKKCNTCNYPDEYFNQLSLLPNSTFEGDCSIYSDKKLKIFSKFTSENSKNNIQLTSFSLGSLQIIQY